MLLDDLIAVIETLQKRIVDHGATLRENETRTRMALIDPLLRALGWDTSNPALVTPEYDVRGRKADYALLGRRGSPAATLEAKRLGAPLSAHLEQMINYSNMSGIGYAGLTDGDYWELYEVFRRGQLEDRRILELRISGTPGHQCALRLLLLWRPNLASGQPMAVSKPILGVSPHSAPDEKKPDPEIKPSLPDLPGWVPPSDFVADSKAKRPKSMRFPGGSEQPIRFWNHLVIETVSWLWSEKKLTARNVPVESSSRRYVVHTKSVHPSGESFISPQPVGGTPLFVETNMSRGTAVANTKILLEHCRQNPAHVHLQVGD